MKDLAVKLQYGPRSAKTRLSGQATMLMSRKCGNDVRPMEDLHDDDRQNHPINPITCTCHHLLRAVLDIETKISESFRLAG